MNHIQQVFVIKAKNTETFSHFIMGQVLNVTLDNLDFYIANGWLLCDGGEQLITDYPELYDCIGAIYSTDTVELERTWWMKLLFIDPITIKVTNCKKDFFRVPNYGTFKLILDPIKS